MIRRKHGDKRRGIALVVVFVMVMLITLAAYRFSFVMQSEYRLAKLDTAKRTHCRAEQLVSRRVNSYQRKSDVYDWHERSVEIRVDLAESRRRG